MAAHRGWKQALLTAVVFAVLAARVPNLWLAGEFVAEDGWSFFATAWNHRFPSSLLIPSGGYLQVLPRLLAELWSSLPIPQQPYACALGGLALNSGLLAIFYLPAFRRLLASDLARLGVVALLAVAPNASNLGLPLGLHWYLAFGLTLCLLASGPATLSGNLAWAAFAILCATSSPSTFVLAPIVLWLWWRDRKPADGLRFVTVLLALLAAAVIAVAARPLELGKTGDFQLLDLAAALPPLLLRGWLATALLGPPLTAWLATHAPGLADVFGATLLITLGAWLWRQRARPAVRNVAVLLSAGLMMSLLSLTRTAYVVRLASSPLPEHDRYLTAPTLLLYVALAVIATSLGARARRLALGGFAVTAVLLATALPTATHWSRPVERYRLRAAVPAIERMVAQYSRDGQPASLYIPTDIPYWGPVLEVGGGRFVPAAAGPVAALEAQRQPDGSYRSWAGQFTFATESGWLNHELLGRIQFAGIEQGRAFFRDTGNRIIFTSPLLHPCFWALKDFQWTLLEPPPKRHNQSVTNQRQAAGIAAEL
jgi:hypothetical protein